MTSIDTIIASYGGVSTTSILIFLSEYQKVNDIYNKDNIKHIRIPPMCYINAKKPLLFSNPKGGYYGGKILRKLHIKPFTATAKLKLPKRAVYIFGDPYNAVLSFFKRKKIRGCFPMGHCNCLEGDYQDIDIEWDIRDFLMNGKDLFRLQEHFINWTTAERSYPILAVKYETMWNHLSELQEFLHLPDSAMKSFPKKRERSSDWRKQPQDIQDGLERIYGKFWKMVDESPSIIRIC